MRELNCLSDTQLVMWPVTEDGVPIDPNTIWMRVFLRAGGKIFYCINDPQGEESKRCHIDGASLIIDIPAKHLRPGTLEYMIEVREKNEFFCDGYKNTFSPKFKPTEFVMT